MPCLTFSFLVKIHHGWWLVVLIPPQLEGSMPICFSFTMVKFEQQVQTEAAIIKCPITFLPTGLIDHHCLAPLFHERLQNVDILILSFLLHLSVGFSYNKNVPSSTCCLQVIRERLDKCMIPPPPPLFTSFQYNGFVPQHPPKVKNQLFLVSL